MHRKRKFTDQMMESERKETNSRNKLIVMNVCHFVVIIFDDEWTLSPPKREQQQQQHQQHHQNKKHL